ncbi:MAG: phosphatidylserine/phosphatidylglycerophosphate/cardiolipin synthase family protein [Deltaproteobacteria bacterium]|nr:phosphatidylserine/phosphatidylglycerophosphate/cardiolipin synthase family protein [Deltaproteobacteria bacterium]
MQNRARCRAVLGVLAVLGSAWPSAAESRSGPEAGLAVYAPLRPPTPRFTKNRVDVLFDKQAFTELEAIVKRATRSIRLDFYIFWGRRAMRIADTLIAKHRAGLDVRVLLDGALGTTPEQQLATLLVVRKLKKAGVRLLYGSPHSAVYKRRTLDHNKYVVIDEREAIVGSTNVGTRFDNWHDLMMKVAGPVARNLADQFDLDYAIARQPGLAATVQPVHLGARLTRTPIPPADGDGRARLVGNGPGRRTGVEALFPLLRRAKKSIHVQLDEFDDLDAAEALVKAHHRGVKVKVLLDPVAFGLLTVLARDRLLAAGIEVRMRKPRKDARVTHLKAVTVDGELLLAGSMNWTHGGFSTVRESCLEVRGGRAPAQVEARFAKEWDLSIPARRATRLELWISRLISKAT